MDDALFSSGKVLSNTLNHQRCRIVFAESCTAGLASATLARCSGISEWHCGSAVTYRNDTKHRWLGVPVELLEPPGPGPVSEPVAQAMALGVLRFTPEADLSAVITGHLGPQAPAELDGLIWIAVARRDASDHEQVHVHLTRCERLPDAAVVGLSVRETRQRLAAQRLLEAATEVAAAGMAP